MYGSQQISRHTVDIHSSKDLVKSKKFVLTSSIVNLLVLTLCDYIVSVATSVML